MTLITTRVGVCFTFGEGSSGQQALPLDRCDTPFVPATTTGIIRSGAASWPFTPPLPPARSGRRFVTRPHAVNGLPLLLGDSLSGGKCWVACGGAHVMVAVRAAGEGAG